MMKGESPPIEPLARVIIQDARHLCEICDNRVILGEENGRNIKGPDHINGISSWRRGADIKILVLFLRKIILQEWENSDIF